MTEQNGSFIGGVDDQTRSTAERMSADVDRVGNEINARLQALANKNVSLNPMAMIEARINALVEFLMPANIDDHPDKPLPSNLERLQWEMHWAQAVLQIVAQVEADQANPSKGLVIPDNNTVADLNLNRAQRRQKR